MSEQSDSKLDALIDEVAHALTNSPVPAHMTASVLARIVGSGQRPRSVTWLTPTAAMAVVLMTLVYIWNRPTRDGHSVQQTVPESAPARGLAAVVATNDGREAEPKDTTAISTFEAPPRMPMRYAESLQIDVAENSAPPGIESISLAEDVVEALSVERLAGIDAIEVHLMAVDSIAIQRLVTQ